VASIALVDSRKPLKTGPLNHEAAECRLRAHTDQLLKKGQFAYQFHVGGYAKRCKLGERKWLVLPALHDNVSRHSFRPYFCRAVSVPGTRIPRPEITGPTKITSCTQRESPEAGVSAIKAAHSGYLRVVGKSLVARECVVADAVAVEPVSQTRFALNREKYREKSIFRPWIVTHSTRKPCAASVFDDCS
jgi:hypothetical protein